MNHDASVEPRASSASRTLAQRAPAARTATAPKHPGAAQRPGAHPSSFAHLDWIARVFRLRRPTAGGERAAEGADSADAQSAEARGAVTAVEAAVGTGAPIAQATDAVPRVDAAQLRDRIGRCLALHGPVTHAWSVSMRVRNDVAPGCGLRLAGDPQGRLSLSLTSELPATAEALHAEKPALLALLAGWSAGPPEVDVRLVEPESVPR